MEKYNRLLSLLYIVGFINVLNLFNSLLNTKLYERGILKQMFYDLLF